VFSGITTCLFPLSVIKTRMMTLDAAQGGSNVGLEATTKAVRAVVSREGVLGLYRGFPTAVTGFLPARLVYLSTLESVKAQVKKTLRATTEWDTKTIIGISSGVSGACASLASQTIFVPVDVISQQQMVSANRVRVVDKVLAILRNEGLRGFYRGYWVSVSLFVPGSAMWWGSYSMYKEQYWKLLGGGSGNGNGAAPEAPKDGAAVDGVQAGDLGASSVKIASSSSNSGGSEGSGSWRLIGIQAVSAVSAGCTTSFVTTPLDVIKTRFQVADRQQGEGTAAGGATTKSSPASIRGTVTSLFQKEGAWGFYRGLFPRMASSSLWGTSMILAYEFLKRNCVLDEA